MRAPSIQFIVGLSALMSFATIPCYSKPTDGMPLNKAIPMDELNVENHSKKLNTQARAEDKSPEIRPITIAPKTAPDRKPAWVDWGDGHVFFSIKPSFSWAYTSAKDKATGSSASIYGHVNYGLGIEVGWVWNMYVRSWAELNFLYQTGYKPFGGESGAGLLGATLGVAGHLLEKLEVIGGFTLAEQVFLEFQAGATGKVLQAYVPQLKVGFLYNFMRHWDYELKTGLHAAVYFASPAGATTSKHNFGAFYEFSFQRDMIDASALVGYETFNTEITTSAMTSVHLRLRFVW